MIKHIIIRLLIAVLPMTVLIYKKFFAANGGGNNGIGIDFPFFLALGILVLWGIYMIYEIFKFWSTPQKELAITNLILCILVFGIFLYIGGQ
jgi:hypothetical protein